MKKYFKREEIRLKELQYKVCYDTTLKFRIGDKVFLKSNPEVPLEVFDVDNEKVHCRYKNEIIEYIPQVLVHYKYAGLMVYKREWDISWN